MSSIALLKLLLQVHPNAPHVEADARTHVHIEVDHLDTMQEVLTLDHPWKYHSLNHLAIWQRLPKKLQKLHRYWEVHISLHQSILVLQVEVGWWSPCQVVCFIQLIVDVYFFWSVHRTLKLNEVEEVQPLEVQGTTMEVVQPSMYQVQVLGSKYGLARKLPSVHFPT